MAKYMLSIFGDSVMWDSMTPAEWEAHDAAHAAFRAAAGDAGGRGRAARVGARGDDAAGRPGRRAGADRRAVPGDQGGARRVLPDRGRRPGPGHRAGARCCPRCAPRTARWRSARWSTTDERGRSSRRWRRPTAASGRRCWRPRRRLTGDLDLAEECAQEAFAQALVGLAGGRHAGPAGRVAHHRSPATGPSTSCAGGPRSGGVFRCWWWARPSTGPIPPWTTTGSG